ncbi:PduM family microcompartment protein [Enterococcus pingfangensis]|uniref:PduM family microcompartment protein n=1 Tax=Enterococcus pingfangensis TaxID=2559924 RepID=UPI0010F952E0|nr:PduM family microcompartment protein [Enterococcus pingfangensis]
MDELVERIISIIIQREKKTLFLSCQASTDIDRGISAFLYNKYIHLTEVDILFLERFKNKDQNDSFIKWLYQSYNYDCCLIFELAFSNTDLIPNELFNECSVKLFNNQGKQYLLFPKKIITFQQVAMLSSKQILLLASNQSITDLAKERLQEMKITVIERSLPYADGKSNWKCSFNPKR